MEKATFVINVLEDSNRRSIEYENKVWLRNNVDTLNIQVSEKKCNVSIHEIKALLGGEDITVIQNGKEVKSKSEFKSGKEALLIFDIPLSGTFVFWCFPKRWK